MFNVKLKKKKLYFQKFVKYKNEKKLKRIKNKFVRRENNLSKNFSRFRKNRKKQSSSCS